MKTRKKAKNRVDSIVDAMARAFFVSEWASDQDEKGWPSGSPSGMDLLEIAPETPLEAIKKAKELYDDIENANNINLGDFVPPGVDEEEFDQEEFGRYLALESMGEGASWSDNWPDHGLEVPNTLAFEGLLLDEDSQYDKGSKMASLKKTIKLLSQQEQTAQPGGTEINTAEGIKFKDLFSKDVASWIQLQARILAMNNYGDWKNIEEANNKIDKAIEDIAGMLSEAGKEETQRIVDEERQDLLEEMSSYLPVQEAPEVQQPTMGPIERPTFPDEQQPQPPQPQNMGASRRAPMSAMLKQAFENASKSHSKLDSVANSLKKAQFEDEADETYEPDEDEPDEEDAFIFPSGPLGGKTSVSVGGKFLGEFSSDDELSSEEKAEEFLREWMDESNWWPSVWKVSDHGNIIGPINIMSKKKAQFRRTAPNQPPKEWWDKMEKEVKEGNPDYSKDQIKKTIGDIWHNELSQSKRDEILNRHEGSSPRDYELVDRDFDEEDYQRWLEKQREKEKKEDEDFNKWKREQDLRDDEYFKDPFHIDKMSKRKIAMNWDTEEVIDWILNDEGLYTAAKMLVEDGFYSYRSLGEDLEDLVSGIIPEVNPNKVDWAEVGEFVAEDL